MTVTKEERARLRTHLERSAPSDPSEAMTAQAYLSFPEAFALLDTLDEMEARAQKAEAACVVMRVTLKRALVNWPTSGEGTIGGHVLDTVVAMRSALADDAGTTLLARHAEEVAGLKLIAYDCNNHAEAYKADARDLEAERDALCEEVAGLKRRLNDAEASLRLVKRSDEAFSAAATAERDALLAWEEAGRAAWAILTETDGGDCPGPWAVRDAADKRDDEAIAAEGERDALAAKVERLTAALRQARCACTSPNCGLCATADDALADVEAGKGGDR